MFKRAVSRVKAWAIKPPPPPPLTMRSRVKKYLYSFIRSPNPKDGKAQGTNDKIDNPDPLKKNQPSITPIPGTQATDSAKIDNTSTGEKAKDSNPNDQKSLKTEITPSQSMKTKGYLWEIRAFFGNNPWLWSKEFILAVFGSLVSFAFVVWKEDLYVKYRLEKAAKDAHLIENLLFEEWLGLKTNVPIKAKGEVTRLPQWGWMWLLRTIPRTLFSWQQIKLNFKARNRQAHATITPIDFSPTIEKVLKIPASQFIIVDGQKGVGKSTAMLLLCWHEIKNHRAALFLRMNKDDKDYSAFLFTKFIKEYPYLIQYLGERFVEQRRKFTIVVDDMNKYLKSTDTRNNATIVIGHLWQATEFFGVRVIFPTSDYGLKQAILELPMHHSARFQQVRMYAPTEKELTEMINSGIQGLGDEKAQGNTPADIARYCEVVGTLRELKLNYLIPGDNPLFSVRQVIQFVFKNNVAALPHLLECVVSAQMDKKHAGQRIADNKLYTSTDVKEVLIYLCKNQYIDAANVKTYELCHELAQANILRPICGESYSFEFHSFQMEVAIRAVLDLPAIQKLPTVQEPGKPESNGRGSQETLSVLKSGDAKFETLKQIFDQIVS